MHKIIFNAVCTALAVGFALPVTANQANVDSLKKEFATVRALELPARAASVVAAASPADRSAAAEDAISAALAVRPSAGPMVVGAIARANSSVAAVSAGIAASLQPRQLPQITKSAVGAAPSEVEAIVTSLTKSKPSAFYGIGMAASDITPKSGDAIVRGISAASPALKALISRANSTHVAVNSPALLAALLNRVNSMVATVSTSGTTDTMLAGDLTPAMEAKLPVSMKALAAGSPPSAPPYTPFGTPGEISAGTGTFAAPSGRDYSSP